MEEKKEIRYVSECLSSGEYAIEYLKEYADSFLKRTIEYQQLEMQKQGYKITKCVFNVDTEGDYYGGSNLVFEVVLYRTETDKEYSDRISRNVKEMQKRELERKAKEAREFTKKKELERLMKDPEYKKFLELKQKFNTK